MMTKTILKHQYPKGEHRDIQRTPQGSILWETLWQSNLIVNGFSQLLAALVKGDEAGQPLAFWAVGIGDAAWDQGEQPSDEIRRNFSTLVNETGRKPIQPENIVFVPDGTLSNQVEINMQFTTADLSEGLENRQLREFGLFAGGSEEPNTGTLINHRIHPRIDLEEDFPLERTLRLTF